MSRSVRAGLGLAFLMMGSACAPLPMTMTPGRPSGPPAEYRIAPPDVLEITVRPEPIITRQVMVRPDGTISFDLIGEVRVEGQTIAKVRDEIYRRIQDFLLAPDVTVTLVTVASQNYYVLGEVNREGAYPLTGRVTAVQALATAGGATELAALNQAQLTRPASEGGAIYRVRFSDITVFGDGTTNYELQPGDVIYLPPNLSGRIGYAVRTLLFPLQQLIGFGGRAAIQSTGL